MGCNQWRLVFIECFRRLKICKISKSQLQEFPSIYDDDVVHDLELNEHKLWLGCKEGLGLLDLNTLTLHF